MSEATQAGARHAQKDIAEDDREGIVVEYLDRSTAYAVPTWCSSSLG
jgi:hypothetical protein